MLNVVHVEGRALVGRPYARRYCTGPSPISISASKKLRVVPVDRPWTDLRDRLTGDAVHDRAVILNFCSQFGVSYRTVLARMKLMESRATIEG